MSYSLDIQFLCFSMMFKQKIRIAYTRNDTETMFGILRNDKSYNAQ